MDATEMVKDGDEMTNELVAIPSNDNNPYAIMPVMDFQAAAYRRQQVVEFMRTLMHVKVDYGVIPGTGDKPTLLKPGAEKLASLFGLSPNFDPIEQVMDWTGDAHGGEPFFYIQYRCTLTRGTLIVGQGVGSCNSWEKKYRWRNVYPEKATTEEKERGRLETRTGKNGRPYQVYVVKNPDPADVVNTIDKMAQKRALVAAVLIAVNASELFTQDIEDYSDVIDGDWQPAPAQPKATPPKAQPSTPPANALLYEDGSFVANDPRTYAIYGDYVKAHDGKAPANKFNLQAWHNKQKNGNAQPAPAEAPTQGAQPVLAIDDPDAVKAASDTAAGLFD